MHYYLNDDLREDGTRVVHAERCQYLPNEENRTALGDYASCETAMRHARETADDPKPCRTCCPDCAN
jgi:hypothetical protein